VPIRQKDEIDSTAAIARIGARGVRFPEATVFVNYPPGGTKMPVPDPNSPQALTTALTEQEAALIVNHLEALGIKADIWGARGLAAWPDVPRDIRVIVRQADLSRAKEALERIQR
jgi:hypothetical protein